MNRHLFLAALALPVCWAAAAAAAAPASQATENPRYKPSSRSPVARDIMTNDYGASRSAPNALGVGDVVPDFTVPRAGGGTVSLADARAGGDVAIIFYRGHW